MTIKEAISAIELKHKEEGITLNHAATEQQINGFELKSGIDLPMDFKEFYSTCNGFECKEDMFRMIPLEEILQDERYLKGSKFDFAEYMLYSDIWTLRKLEERHEITNFNEVEIVLTTSLLEFLQRFLTGNVFEEGGLYDWQNDLKQA